MIYFLHLASRYTQLIPFYWSVCQMLGSQRTIQDHLLCPQWSFLILGDQRVPFFSVACTARAFTCMWFLLNI